MMTMFWVGANPRGACSNSIRNLGMVGHIEDISVAKDQQGKKLGQIIIETLSGVAEKVGCYKVYLFGDLMGSRGS